MNLIRVIFKKVNRFIKNIIRSCRFFILTWDLKEGDYEPLLIVLKYQLRELSNYMKKYELGHGREKQIKEIRITIKCINRILGHTSIPSVWNCNTITNRVRRQKQILKLFSKMMNKMYTWWAI